MRLLRAAQAIEMGFADGEAVIVRGLFSPEGTVDATEIEFVK